MPGFMGEMMRTERSELPAFWFPPPADSIQLSFRRMVRPERFELPAFWFVARRSIQLSYGRISVRQILASALFAVAPPVNSLVSAAGGLYPAELREHFVSCRVPTAYSKFRRLFNRDLRGIRK